MRPNTPIVRTLAPRIAGALAVAVVAGRLVPHPGRRRDHALGAADHRQRRGPAGRRRLAAGRSAPVHHRAARRRRARAHQDLQGRRAPADAVPDHGAAGDRERAGAAGAGVPARLRDQRRVLHQLHERRRRGHDAHRAPPRLGGQPRPRRLGSARCSSASCSRTPTTTAAGSASGPTATSTSRWATAATRGIPGDRAQNLNSHFGKILRFDVSGATGYTVPPDNPFVGATPGRLPEIWSLRAAQSVPLQLRPRDRRPGHRRRRAGAVGGDRLRARARPGSRARTTAGSAGRAITPTARARRPPARRARTSACFVFPAHEYDHSRRPLLGDRGLRLSRLRDSRPAGHLLLRRLLRRRRSTPASSSAATLTGVADRNAELDVGHGVRHRPGLELRRGCLRRALHLRPRAGRCTRSCRARASPRPTCPR